MDGSSGVLVRTLLIPVGDTRSLPTLISLLGLDSAVGDGTGKERTLWCYFREPVQEGDMGDGGLFGTPTVHTGNFTPYGEEEP